MLVRYTAYVGLLAGDFEKYIIMLACNEPLCFRYSSSVRYVRKDFIFKVKIAIFYNFIVCFFVLITIQFRKFTVRKQFKPH